MTRQIVILWTGDASHYPCGNSTATEDPSSHDTLEQEQSVAREVFPRSCDGIWCVPENFKYVYDEEVLSFAIIVCKLIQILIYDDFVRRTQFSITKENTDLAQHIVGSFVQIQEWLDCWTRNEQSLYSRILMLHVINYR
jgi:hypothetical protein